MVDIDVYWVKARIITDDQNLESFIKSYYNLFLIEKKDFSPKLIISIKKYWYFEKVPVKNQAQEYVTVGDDIKINYTENKYSFRDREIFWTVKFDKTWIIYVGWYLKPRKIHHLVNLILQGIVRLDKYYNRFIIKSLIHDPIFMLLEECLWINILHATAVSNWKKTLIFTGLWWSGKSTLAAAFFTKKWYTILADNYCLVQGDMLYPFPELPRITNQTSRLLDIKGWRKADWIKTYLENDISNIQKKYKIDKVFICGYSKSFLIKEIENENQIFEILLWINHYTKEFPEYLNLALLPLLGKYQTGWKRQQNLTKFIHENRFFILENSKDLDLNLTTIENV